MASRLPARRALRCPPSRSARPATSTRRTGERGEADRGRETETETERGRDRQRQRRRQSIETVTRDETEIRDRHRKADRRADKLMYE